MHGTVVKEGRIYQAPGQRGQGAIGHLRRNQLVKVHEPHLDGAWARITAESPDGPLTGFTRTYRLAVGIGSTGKRLDRHYGYEGWQHKPDPRDPEEKAVEEGRPEDPPRRRLMMNGEVYYEVTKDDVSNVPVEPPVSRQECSEIVADQLAARLAADRMVEFLSELGDEEETEPAIPVQSAILNSGNQMELPPTDVPLGRLEPGNNWLALFDRYLTSKERRQALSTINPVNSDVSTARYALAATVARCASASVVLGLALYGSYSLLTRFIP